MTNQPPPQDPKIVGSAMRQDGSVNAQNIAGRDINITNKFADKPLRFPLRNLSPANPSFVGRVGLLAALDRGVKDGRSSILTQTIAGLGGIGKSQVALAYAHTHLDDYDLIWWLTADPETTLLEGFRDLGRQLQLNVDATPDIKAAVQLTVSWLASANQRWLLIIDNVDVLEPQQVRHYLPGTGNGHVLITSRNPNWQGIVAAGQLHTVDLFTPEEALTYFETELTNRPLGFSKPEGFKLAKALGYLPLALTHATAYINTRHKSCAEYLHLFEERQADLLQRANQPNDYHATIMTTWQIAFDQVQQTPAAADLLILCSCLAPDDIPLTLIGKLGEVSDTPLQDALQFDEAIAALSRYSLITREPEALSMHRLVQLVVRNGLEESMLAEWLKSAASLLRKTYRFDKHDMTTWPACAALLPHMRTVADLAAAVPLATDDASFVNYEIGYYLRQFINLAQAHPYYERALAIREEVLGEKHQDTAISVNNIGVLLQAMGEYEKAKAYFERALAIFEEVMGANHSRVALSMNNIGVLLQAMGKYEPAKAYYERALAIREEVLGESHPDTAQSVNNMGFLLQAMGENEKAKPYYERALRIFEEVLGKKHPHTAQCVNNMGYLLRAMGEYEKAKPYSEMALAIREEVLGESHPDTAQSVNNMGALLQVMGENEKAKAYYERALAIREEVLGESHPDTAISLNNLAVLHCYLGEYPKSGELMRRALAIREARLGVNHPDTISSRESLAAIESKLTQS